MAFNEKNFKILAKKELLCCRAGDWNHALRVVKWVKILAKDRDDIDLILYAGYLHDIGWRDVLPSETKITLEKLRAFEKQANENSNSYVSKFLKDLKFTKGDISNINRLVNAADTRKHSSEDEAIIVDADNLSKLSISHLKEKYKPTEWLKVHKMWVDQFPVRIGTELGKSYYPDLLKKLKISLEKELINVNTYSK